MKREYIVTISNKTIKKLSPILFYNLPFNAQIGVLGHELSHIVTYINNSTLKMLAIPFGFLSRTYVDNFEYYTDFTCIQHGLGYQLLDWSKYVRDTLKI